MLVIYMQAMLLASFHTHHLFSQNESVKACTEYAVPASQDNVDACLDCPVCQFLANLQLDFQHQTHSFRVHTVSEPFILSPSNPLAGQFSCVSCRAPPFEFCL